MRTGTALCAAAILITCCSVVTGQEAAKEKAHPKRLAHEAVVRALKLEVAGGASSERDAALEEALAQVKDYAPVRWLRGEISENGKWLTMEESAKKHAAHPYLRAYEKKRKQTRDTEEGHWEMATWCGPRSMWPQKYAHLCRVLELNPRNDAARVGLGWRQTNFGWVSPEQVMADVDLALQARASFDKYGDAVHGIVRKLTSSNEEMKAKGSKELSDLKDPIAVPAIEKNLSSVSEPLALRAIHVLQEIQHPAATRSLVRHAIFHPSGKVRDQAGDALAKRDPQGWAPGLLGLLKETVKVGVQFEYSELGELHGVRHYFQQESSDRADVLVVDSTYEHFVVAIANDAFSTRPNFGTAIEFRPQDQLFNAQQLMAQEMRTQHDASFKIAQAKAIGENVNANVRQFNERIFQVVDKFADQKIGDTASEYWEWWYSNKDWKYSSSNKPTGYVYRKNSSYDSRLASYSLVQPDTGGSCFAKGVEIWTQSGRKAIEEVRIGDLVFGKDIRSGEIRLAPVIRTTTRTKAPTLRISTSTGELQCSKGHEFFVIGHGWRKAIELKPEDRLCGADEGSLVKSIQEADHTTVYNLVVPNCSNYFVGEGKILSHDFSERAENYYLIPGLAPSEK